MPIHDSTLFLYIIIAVAVSAVTMLYLTTNAYAALRHKRKQQSANADVPGSVTALVPVYNEDISLFKECISAITEEGVTLVVVGDGVSEPYRHITESYGGSFVHQEKRAGKRAALSRGMNHIASKYVMLVDSDTVIPRHAVKRLLSNFDERVGGVGTSAGVRMNDKSMVSYMAEFFNRIRDTTFRAMSHFNTAMVLGGWCAMYRTELVKPFMLSPEFTNCKILGVKSLLADDRHITSEIMHRGYRAVIDYDVRVMTAAPKTLAGVVRQMLRWSRAGYLYFFKEIFDGSFFKKGKFYSFEMTYMYALPMLLVPLTLWRFLLPSRFNSLSFLTSLFQPAQFALPAFPVHHALIILYYVFQGGIILAAALFLYAISKSVRRKKAKTLAAGAFVMLLVAATSIFGLVTMFRQENWITR